MSMVLPQRGDVWLADLPGDKIRPVVILTREPVIRHLRSVIAAPVTARVRGIPTEVSLAREEGLLHDAVANFDNLQLVPRARLVRPIGVLSRSKLPEACRALRFATSC